MGREMRIRTTIEDPSGTPGTSDWGGPGKGKGSGGGSAGTGVCRGQSRKTARIATTAAGGRTLGGVGRSGKSASRSPSPNALKAKDPGGGGQGEPRGGGGGGEWWGWASIVGGGLGSGKSSSSASSGRSRRKAGPSTAGPSRRRRRGSSDKTNGNPDGRERRNGGGRGRRGRSGGGGGGGGGGGEARDEEGASSTSGSFPASRSIGPSLDELDDDGGDPGSFRRLMTVKSHPLDGRKVTDAYAIGEGSDGRTGTTGVTSPSPSPSGTTDGDASAMLEPPGKQHPLRWFGRLFGITPQAAEHERREPTTVTAPAGSRLRKAASAPKATVTAPAWTSLEGKAVEDAMEWTWHGGPRRSVEMDALASPSAREHSPSPTARVWTTTTAEAGESLTSDTMEDEQRVRSREWDGKALRPAVDARDQEKGRIDFRIDREGQRQWMDDEDGRGEDFLFMNDADIDEQEQRSPIDDRVRNEEDPSSAEVVESAVEDAGRRDVMEEDAISHQRTPTDEFFEELKITGLLDEESRGTTWGRNTPSDNTQLTPRVLPVIEENQVVQGHPIDDLAESQTEQDEQDGSPFTGPGPVVLVEVRASTPDDSDMDMSPQALAVVSRELDIGSSMLGQNQALSAPVQQEATEEAPAARPHAPATLKFSLFGSRGGEHEGACEPELASSSTAQKETIEASPMCKPTTVAAAEQMIDSEGDKFPESVMDEKGEVKTVQQRMEVEANALQLSPLDVLSEDSDDAEILKRVGTLESISEDESEEEELQEWGTPVERKTPAEEPAVPPLRLDKLNRENTPEDKVDQSSGHIHWSLPKESVQKTVECRSIETQTDVTLSDLDDDISIEYLLRRGPADGRVAPKWGRRSPFSDRSDAISAASSVQVGKRALPPLPLGAKLPKQGPKGVVGEGNSESGGGTGSTQRKSNVSLSKPRKLKTVPWSPPMKSSPWRTPRRIPARRPIKQTPRRKHPHDVRLRRPISPGRMRRSAAVNPAVEGISGAFPAAPNGMDRPKAPTPPAFKSFGNGAGRPSFTPSPLPSSPECSLAQGQKSKSMKRGTVAAHVAAFEQLSARGQNPLDVQQKPEGPSRKSQQRADRHLPAKGRQLRRTDRHLALSGRIRPKTSPRLPSSWQNLAPALLMLETQAFSPTESEESERREPRTVKRNATPPPVATGTGKLIGDIIVAKSGIDVLPQSSQSRRVRAPARSRNGDGPANVEIEARTSAMTPVSEDQVGEQLESKDTGIETSPASQDKSKDQSVSKGLERVSVEAKANEGMDEVRTRENLRLPEIEPVRTGKERQWEPIYKCSCFGGLFPRMKFGRRRR